MRKLENGDFANYGLVIFKDNQSKSEVMKISGLKLKNKKVSFLITKNLYTKVTSFKISFV